MSKKLVAYFSVTGVTKRAAEALAELEQADIYEIEPEVAYTMADLDYRNHESRSTVEMKDLNARPAIKTCIDLSEYDVIFVGFPVWWGRNPSIVDTFIEQNDMSGKRIVPFCTSGGSGVEGGAKRMAELTEGKAVVEGGIRLGGNFDPEELKVWTAGLGL